MSGQVRAHIQLSRGEEVLGKLVIELYSQIYPYTVRGFVGLMQLHLLPDHARASHEQSIGAKLPPPLHGSKITRINADESVEFGTSATESFLGGMFPNEPRADVLEREEQAAAAQQQGGGSAGTTATAADIMSGLEEISHKFGTLSMSNMGPNTNASNFFLCLMDETNPKNGNTIRALNNNHTVFGVIKNPASLQLLRDLGSQVKVNRQNVPVEPIKLSEMAVEQVAPSGFGNDGRKLTKKEAKMQRLREKEAARQARQEGVVDNKRGIFARAADDQPEDGGDQDDLSPQTRTIEDDEVRPNKRRRFEPAGPAARPIKGILSSDVPVADPGTFAARGPRPERSTLAGTGVTQETAARRGTPGAFNLFSAQSNTFNSDIKELSANQRAKKKRKMSKY